MYVRVSPPTTVLLRPSTDKTEPERERGKGEGEGALHRRSLASYLPK
jgi:hypothetical protein